MAKITCWQRVAAGKYYHSLLLTALLAAGHNVDSETSTRLGRSDLTVTIPNNSFVIIVIKYLPNVNRDKADNILNNALDAALDQINFGDYAGPYIILTLKILLAWRLFFTDRIGLP
ncbi:MAG: PD-(D/E)XK nuclease domain-containing protein [Deltaproteobacteria bacterium]|nr:PD-(D/E)XK nuclease domain-containing protein [Deltaproteobacteria bacterium]